MEKLKIAIALLSYDRFDYLVKTLTTLKKSNLKSEKIEMIKLLIIDDKSKDERVMNFINNFSIDGIEIIKKRLLFNRGHPNYTAKISMKIFQKRFPYFDLFGIIDNDIIFGENWLLNLIDLYEEVHKKNLKVSFYTAFNIPIYDEKKEKIVYEQHETDFGSYELRRSFGGIQVLFKPQILKEFGWWKKKPSRRGWDWQMSVKSMNKGYKVIAPSISNIQHIGAHGLHSKGTGHDEAHSFKEY
jgi:hypothetical protein